MEDYKDLIYFESHFDYYEMKNRNNFNDETTPFASFSNNEQYESEVHCRNAVFLAVTSSSLYTMNNEDDVVAIPPSGPGFYSVEFISHTQRFAFLNNK
jgi:hypothetical protein